MKRQETTAPPAGSLLRIGALGALLPFLASTPVAAQQPYPVKPIRFLVGFAPGGPTDILARLVGKRFTERWGQQVIVDNRAGAHGIIASELTAKASPDGYTLLMVTAGHAVNPSLYKTLPYNTVNDFAALSLVASSPLILVLNTALPVKTVKDFIAFAKAKPGQLSYASAGVGGPPHLAAELFKSMAGISMTHVPYGGSGQSFPSVMGGETQLTFANMLQAMPLIKAGKMNALGITSAKRSPAAPELPTLAESGLSGYEAITWYGALAPAKTPRETVALLGAEIAKTVQAPDVKEQLSRLGVDAVGSSPAEFAAYLRDEIEKWAKVVRISGATAH